MLLGIQENDSQRFGIEKPHLGTRSAIVRGLSIVSDWRSSRKATAPMRRELTSRGALGRETKGKSSSTEVRAKTVEIRNALRARPPVFENAGTGRTWIGIEPFGADSARARATGVTHAKRMRYAGCVFLFCPSHDRSPGAVQSTGTQPCSVLSRAVLASTPSLRECQGPDYGGWPQMGRWLVPFICRAKAYRQSRCCIRPGRRCLPRSSRRAIRAENSVPCLK